jgi:enoyl-CoA hydratase
VAEDILLVEIKGRVATLVLNRPEKRNSLSPELLLRLHQTLEALKQEEAVRTVVLRGAGDKAFSAGYDIASIPARVPPAMQEKLKTRNPLDLAVQSLIHFPYPVMALLNGDAFGAGCELALCCDLRLAAEDIRMGMPPARLGLVYPPVGLIRFIQVIGPANARELFFTGRFYPVQRAKEMGLVHYVLPREELASFTYAMAEEMAANAPLSLQGLKRIFNLAAQTLTLPERDQAEAETLLARALNSEDLKEGQTAFFQKRKPVFKGR